MLHNRYQLNLKKKRDTIPQTTCTCMCARCYLPASSWWMRSAKFGSSPHQKSQSSRRPCRWLRRHTLSTSAFRQRLKLHSMGSSSVTGNSIGAEVGPCHTKLFHLIPVRSAWHTREREGGRRSPSVQSCCFQIHSDAVQEACWAQFKESLSGFPEADHPHTRHKNKRYR